MSPKINGKTKTLAGSLCATECQRELVRDELLVVAWLRFWLKAHFPKAIKFVRYLGLQSENKHFKFNIWIYFKKQGNILNICYHKINNLIMCLKQQNIIWSMLPVFHENNLPLCVTISKVVLYELLLSHILFWLCLFYRFMSGLKGTLGEQKSSTHFFSVWPLRCEE